MQMTFCTEKAFEGALKVIKKPLQTSASFIILNQKYTIILQVWA